MGAQNVLVSMAGEGAVLITERDEVYQTEAPKGIVKNAVGAGDSMVAGFLAGYLSADNYKEAFKMGVCAGSASAFSDELATQDEILKILNTHQFNL
jgi:1-phosphofructokinase